MNRLTLMIAVLFLMAFTVTFLLTWWIRGWGFGELLELFGRKKEPPDGERRR
jgi:hypothetical protein